jgi:hypothetical protein
LISITKMYQEDGNWYIQGSSEVFNSREEALERLKSMRPKKQQKKSVEGRRFYSEKLDMYFRSNWEIELAEILTELNIKFEYEPERFYFRAERESYLPDFYLTDYNCYVEVKGWMDKRSLKRVKLFKKYYGREYGFFLYEKEERELCLKTPALLRTLISTALEQLRREKMR